MFRDFYRGKRVFVTGHTGFKGGWLSLWLKQLGASVFGYALPPLPSPNLYEVVRPTSISRETLADIRDPQALSAALKEASPDIIFHLAAQPLVRLSYAEPYETFETNVMGTVNLLESVRLLGMPATVVVATSDKCYENAQWDYAYRENDPLGGHDVYSTSKAAAELAVQTYRRSFFAVDPKLGNIATVRAGNVVGGGDYAKDRIVPDCIRALEAGEPIKVRNPKATRPWQHVLDCLSGYLTLGAALAQAPKNSPLASAFNFGPGPLANLPVKAVVEELLKSWPGKWADVSDPNQPHEASRLNLAIDKAAAQLGWAPTWSFAEAIQQTAVWHRERHSGDREILKFTIGQLESFTAKARANGQTWAA
ncbi:MAG TPA: CDP-glucose 4,6-dehydratase [Methylomirabilota bacterium]|nr:CDP-glucose 4,6-dehydratase [Methylomirabilota bacterium]